MDRRTKLPVGQAIPQVDLDRALENKPIIDVVGVGRPWQDLRLASSRTSNRTSGVHLGSHSPAPSPTPSFPYIERLLRTIGDEFVRWIPDTRTSVSHRGRNPSSGDTAAASLYFQALPSDEWASVTGIETVPTQGFT